MDNKADLFCSAVGNHQICYFFMLVFTNQQSDSGNRKSPLMAKSGLFYAHEVIRRESAVIVENKAEKQAVLVEKQSLKI